MLGIHNGMIEDVVPHVFVCGIVCLRPALETPIQPPIILPVDSPGSVQLFQWNSTLKEHKQYHKAQGKRVETYHGLFQSNRWRHFECLEVEHVNAKRMCRRGSPDWKSGGGLDPENPEAVNSKK